MTTPEAPTWRVVMRHAWFKPVVIIVASLVVGWFVLRFVGKVAWSDVAASFRAVHAGELFTLLAMLLVRQVFNSVPIARFTPGLGVKRAVISDLSANLTSTFAPPPSDVVVRVAQFRTWNINPLDGMAGATLNMLVFYGARFAAPAIGASVFCVHAFDGGRVITGAVCLAAAVLIVGVLVAVLRSDAVAVLLARRAARAAAALKANVDEQRWVDAVVDFRRRIGTTLDRGLALALCFMVLGIVVDALMLLAAVRFVGLDPSVAPWPVVVGSMLLAYPLTILPAFGLGVMDAVVIASVVETAGAEHESALVAATMLWRSVTLLGPLALGALAMLWWRASARRREKATPASGG